MARRIVAPDRDDVSKVTGRGVEPNARRMRRVGREGADERTTVGAVFTRIRAVYGHRSILWLLVRRDLRVRYADSYLGYVWTILDPLLMALVFWFIFTVLFSRGRFGAEPYIVFLLVGLLPWNWCNGVIGSSTKSITGQSKLVRSTRLPREVWPLRLVGSKFLEMLLSLPIVIVFAAAVRRSVRAGTSSRCRWRS